MEIDAFGHRSRPAAEEPKFKGLGGRFVATDIREGGSSVARRRSWKAGLVTRAKAASTARSCARWHAAHETPAGVVCAGTRR